MKICIRIVVQKSCCRKLSLNMITTFYSAFNIISYKSDKLEFPSPVIPPLLLWKITVQFGEGKHCHTFSNNCSLYIYIYHKQISSIFILL